MNYIVFFSLQTGLYKALNVVCKKLLKLQWAIVFMEALNDAKSDMGTSF